MRLSTLVVASLLALPATLSAQEVRASASQTLTITILPQPVDTTLQQLKAATEAKLMKQASQIALKPSTETTPKYFAYIFPSGTVVSEDEHRKKYGGKCNDGRIAILTREKGENVVTVMAC